MTKILFSLTSLKNINFPRLWVKFPDFSLTFYWPFPDLWQDKGKNVYLGQVAHPAGAYPLHEATGSKTKINPETDHNIGWQTEAGKQGFALSKNANKTFYRIPQSAMMYLATLWHKRCFLPFAVWTSGFLSKRRKLIIRSLRNLDRGFSRRMQRNELSYIEGNMCVHQQDLLIVDFRDSKICLGPFHYYTTCVQIELDH